MVQNTVTVQTRSAYWLHRLAMPHLKPVAVARMYNAVTKNPTSIIPISPMYLYGYMLPSGICVSSPLKKVSPIWGTRFVSAGITFRRVNNAVNPRAPTHIFLTVSIGFTVNLSLCTKYDVAARLMIVRYIARRRKRND